MINWRNKNLLFAAALIGMIMIVSAATIIVQTEEEASAKIGKSIPATVAEDGCVIINISKTITNENELLNNYKVEYQLHFTIDGIPAESIGGIVEITDGESQTAAQAAVVPACEALFAQAQKDHATIEVTEVIIQPDNAARGSFYNLGTRIWGRKE